MGQDRGHRYGLHVMMYCCGSFAPLIPVMIGAGIDALQSLQPCTSEMAASVLKGNFGDKIIFNGCIDSHHILINGTIDLVRGKTQEILDIMMPGEGYIFSPSHDYLLEETPVEMLLLCMILQ
jgi:uroporphyrinogen decarboxylase